MCCIHCGSITLTHSHSVHMSVRLSVWVCAYINWYLHALVPPYVCVWLRLSVCLCTKPMNRGKIKHKNNNNNNNSAHQVITILRLGRDSSHKPTSFAVRACYPTQRCSVVCTFIFSFTLNHLYICVVYAANCFSFDFELNRRIRIAESGKSGWIWIN